MPEENKEMNVYDLYQTAGYRFDETFSLFYTYRCNIKCAHCSFNCGPGRTEKMDVNEAKALLKAASSLGKRLVSLSGGEIFLYYDELSELVAYGAGLGMEVVVDTNGYWGKNPDDAKEKLGKLANIGLKRILVSADTFHQQFVPLASVFNIIRAARELGIDSGIWFCTSDDKDRDSRFLDDLKKETENIYIIETIPCGAAARLTKGISKHASEFEPCEGLSVCTLPNGDTFVCCVVSDDNTDIMDTPLYMGNCIREKPEDVIGRKNLLCLQSFFEPDTPIWFKNFLQQEPYKKVFENKQFSHICELCIDMLHHRELGCKIMESDSFVKSSKGEI